MLFTRLFCKESISKSSFVADECEMHKKDGCSTEAADLIERCFRKKVISESIALLAAEELPYCNNIKELKSRFAIKERPEERIKNKHGRLDPVFGAVYGDIIGSKYEGKRIKDISEAVNNPLQPACRPTDDSILTIATLNAISQARRAELYDRKIRLEDINVHSIYPIRYNAYTRPYRDMARRFPAAGYGSAFIDWVEGNDERPYGSLGNGSAMRVSPIGALYDNVSDVIEQAAVSAMATHNHIEGVKGAVITAVCIWMARNGYSKEQIFKYMKKHYSYGASMHIFKDYTYEEASHKCVNQVECSYSVPAAVISFFHSKDYMDAIGLSACVGLDTDTNACICGGIAGAYYGVTDNVKDIVSGKLRNLFGNDPLMDIAQML